MSTYPAESFYRGTIRQSIANNTSVPFTLKVSKIPTLTSGLLTISPNTSNEEIVEYDGVDGVALTITVVKRGISPSAQALTVNGTDYNNVTYQKSHSQNDTIRGDVNHLHIIQDYGSLQAQINDKVNTAGGVRTGLTANGIITTDGSGNEVIDSIDDSSIVGSDKLIYNRGGDYKQGLASELLATVTGLSSEYILGGNIVMNECVYVSTLNKWKKTATPMVTIGATVANTTFKMYSSGNTEQSYTFFFTKTGTPQDLTFRIETDDGSGNPSGTLVDANAVLVTPIASITTNAVYEIVLPASFNLGVAGTPIHFVFWQGSHYVNASNYISIGINDEVCVVHDKITSPGSNISATRVISGGAGTAASGTWSTQMDCIADCQLMSMAFYAAPSVTLFEVFNVTDNVTTYKDPIAQSGVTLKEPVQLKSGKRYELRYTFNSTLNNISGFNTQVNSAHLQWVSSAGGNSITGVTTRPATFTPNAATLSQYVSKSVATTTVNAEVYGFSTQTYSQGTYPILKKDGYLGGFTGLTRGFTYYLSDTGTLSMSAGTVSKVLGVAINSTTIRIDSAINIS